VEGSGGGAWKKGDERRTCAVENKCGDKIDNTSDEDE
jgi:hypothetical protein